MSEILILTTDTSDSQEEHDRAKLRMDTLASHTVACVSLGPTSWEDEAEREKYTSHIYSLKSCKLKSHF